MLQLMNHERHKVREKEHLDRVARALQSPNTRNKRLHLSSADR